MFTHTENIISAFVLGLIITSLAILSVYAADHTLQLTILR